HGSVRAARAVEHLDIVAQDEQARREVNLLTFQAQHGVLAVPMLLALTQRLSDLGSKIEQTTDLEGDVTTDGLLLPPQRHKLTQALQRRVSCAGMAEEERGHLQRLGR